MPRSDLPAHVVRQRQQVGARIRALRAHRRLTQEQLAAATGLDRQTIYRAELATHAISIDSAALIADALGVPTAGLFTDDDLPPGSQVSPTPRR